MQCKPKNICGEFYQHLCMDTIGLAEHRGCVTARRTERIAETTTTRKMPYLVSGSGSRVARFRLLMYHVLEDAEH